MLSAPSGVNLASLDKFPEGARVMIGCAVAAVRPTATKKDGRRMAMLTLEDLFGKSDAVVFPDTYEKTRPLLEKDALVFVSGSIDRRREKPSIIVDDLIPINAALEQLTLAIKLTLPGIQPGGEFLGRLQDVLTRHAGGAMLVLEITPATRGDVRCLLRPDRKWFVKPNRKLMDELIGLLGEENLTLSPKPLAAPNNRRGNWQRNGAPSGQNGVASEAVTRFN